MNEESIELLKEAFKIINNKQEQEEQNSKREHERKKCIIWAVCIVVCVGIISLFFSPNEFEVINRSESIATSSITN